MPVTFLALSPHDSQDSVAPDADFFIAIQSDVNPIEAISLTVDGEPLFLFTAPDTVEVIYPKVSASAVYLGQYVAATVRPSSP